MNLFKLKEWRLAPSPNAESFLFETQTPHLLKSLNITRYCPISPPWNPTSMMNGDLVNQAFLGSSILCCDIVSIE